MRLIDTSSFVMAAWLTTREMDATLPLIIS